MKQVSINTPEELVGLLPTLLGFTPSESIVVIQIKPDQSVGVVARWDIEDDLATETFQRMHTLGVEDALVIVVTDTDYDPEPLREIAQDSGINVVSLGAAPNITTPSAFVVEALVDGEGDFSTTREERIKRLQWRGGSSARVDEMVSLSLSLMLAEAHLLNGTTPRQAAEGFAEIAATTPDPCPHTYTVAAMSAYLSGDGFATAELLRIALELEEQGQRLALARTLLAALDVPTSPDDMAHMIVSFSGGGSE